MRPPDLRPFRGLSCNVRDGDCSSVCAACHCPNLRICPTSSRWPLWKAGVFHMKLALAAVALVYMTTVIVPASAVSIPSSHSDVSLIETVQQNPQSKPSPEKQKRERCFIACWNSCWGFHCVERCRCQCSDAKPDYCA